MRLLLKKLWLIAGNTMTALMSLFSVLLFSSYKVAKQIKRQSKGVDKDRKAFVLGNGPSLKEILTTPKMNEELLEGEVIVTNRFAICEDFKKLKPHYYILMDPAFFSEGFVEKDATVSAMYEALNNVDWNMLLFLPKEADIEVVERYLTNSCVQIIQYNGTTVIGPKCFQNWIYRHGMGLPNSRNIIIPAIMLMINMGYNKIYVYGAEFSWTKSIDVDPRNNRVFLNDGHFYNNDNIHYYEKGWYRWYLDTIVQMLYGTEQLAIYAESRGIKVINRTKGSFIDAFEYENPDEI